MRYPLSFLSTIRQAKFAFINVIFHLYYELIIELISWINVFKNTMLINALS